MRATRLPPAAPATRATRRRASPSPGSARERLRARTTPATARVRSWITVRVRRRVATFEADLMQSMRRVLEEEVAVEADAAVWIHIELHHPTADAVRIKLLVPRGVKRVGEIYTLAVAAHLDH